MSIDPATIVSLIGALGIGSMLGQWASGSKDRRTARAAVLKEIAAVERARWSQTEDPVTDGKALADAAHALETAR